MLVCGFGLIPVLVMVTVMFANDFSRHTWNDITRVGIGGATFSFPISIVWLLVLACRKKKSPDFSPVLKAAVVALLIMVLFGSVGPTI